MKRILLFLLTVLTAAAQAQNIPEKPYPPRLVNDFAGILNSREINALESKLVAFNDSTTTQIAIVTVNDLNGYGVSDYAQRLGEKWGVGQKGFDNGIVILVKSQSGSSKGEISIQQGYGLEGAIPDILCGQIIDYEILPSFRNGQYYEGLDKAADALMALARGDFPADKYKGKKSDLGALLPFIIFVIVLIIIVSARSGGGKNQKHISDKGLPVWLLLSMMNSGRSSHSGSWGGFSGGGGGGGFGGFGGGSFGGGGASGSW